MQAMTIDEFDAAIGALGWKVSDFCRATGLHRNTPSGWRNLDVPIPQWVPQHLGLLLDLKRLQAAYLVPTTHPARDWFKDDLKRLHDSYLTPPGSAAE